jgi:predicted nucleic acid-binding protein
MSRRKQARPKAFVLDCSVTLAWFFKDEANAYANAVAARVTKTPPMVPVLWPLEVANAVLMGERRKRSTEGQAARWLGHLRLLPIAVDTQAATHAWDKILHLARSNNLSVYDAAYLELALRLDWPLASLDDELMAAAKVVGVAIFSP